MGASRTHTFKFTEEGLRRIDYLLPKLKFSVMPSKIVRWLENFEETDLEYAYDFLQIFEYVDFKEFQYRIEDQLKSILEELSEKDKILVVPFGKFGKSATLVTYPLTHSDTFKKLNDNKRIFLTNDFKSFKKQIECIIFLDDFVGTGETFCNDYTKSGLKTWCDSLALSKRFVLSAIVMEKGRDNIETSYPNIVVKAQGRGKIYKEGFSPFSNFGKVKDYEAFSNKYESKTAMTGYLNGYGDSQSLVAFAHCTPDNTIPTFWWDKDWFPLYPREDRTRMEEARQFKKSIAFYIGICNRLNIDLLTLQKYKKAGFDVDFENQHRYNTKLHHSIIALLKLKLDGTEDYIISHILGLTDLELDEIYERAENLGFTDLSRNLTTKASIYLRKLEQKIRKEKFRKASEENLKPKELIYIPNTFEGLT